MAKIRVADYVVKRLVEHGVKHVFMVTGGGAMHLNDAFGRNENVECVFNHHEQACAIAAEGYTRSSGKICAVNITTGPGGLNTLTGVLGQWTDSIPAIYLSGQVKHETTIASCRHVGLRQLGDQECSIIDVVSPITKYAKMLVDPSDCKRVIDEAVGSATSGRPGPVWIDIPMNVQGAVIDENDFDTEYSVHKESFDIDRATVSLICEEIKIAHRPIIVAGHGIRISGALEYFEKLISCLRIPVVTTFNGFDLLSDDHPLFVGRIGTIGQRSGNFALQNADVVLFLGTRNNIRQVSYNWKTFARDAKKIIVEIDGPELLKPTIKPDIGINTDLSIFLKAFIENVGNANSSEWARWLNWCKERQRRYPVVLDEYYNADKINPYLFINRLTCLVDRGNTIICGNGSACVCAFQAGVVKKNNRIFWNSGCASMGYDLPASIGACFANGRRQVICIAGEGSLMMNIQELQTVKHFNLPIKLFVLNNGGYSSIRQTQKSFFGEPLIGCDTSSGVSFPDFSKVASAFGLEYFKLFQVNKIDRTINQVLSLEKPVVCEVVLSEDYTFNPKLSSKKNPDGTISSPSLEDMFPFLEPEEFNNNIYPNK